MKTKRTKGEVKSLPRRNNWGQLQYRVAVDAKFAAEINAEWVAATQATPKLCLNTTAPAWYNDETGVWTVTVQTGKAGMYPAGVSYGKPCNVSFRIADKYTQVIASATEEIAEKNAAIAVEKMEAVREAISEREFDEKITGINAKLREMAKLASELGIPLGDLMSANKAIEDEKDRAATAKKTLTKKGSSLRTFVPSGTKTDDAKPEPPKVILNPKTIEKWGGLSDDELDTAMKTYADTTGVELADIVEAWELALATAEQD